LGFCEHFSFGLNPGSKDLTIMYVGCIINPSEYL
jgi:hypothetical protein